MKVIGVTMPGAFSGADDALFLGLRDRGYLGGIVAANLSAFWRAAFLVSAVSYNRSRWFSEWHRKMMKTPLAFKARTQTVTTELVRREREFDMVLQVGGLSAPYTKQFMRPFALFCDYTTKLAERNYRPWFGVSSRHVDEWYDLETDLYHKADLIFTASENTRQSIVNDYTIPEERVRVVGEGVYNIGTISERTYRNPTILMVGIDFERKGGAALLEAFEIVKKQVRNARLVIVGPSPRFSSANIVWEGHVNDRARLDQLFDEACVFAMPSICEPFGLAIIEAMSHGLPVVGSTVDAMSEIIEEGKTGYLVAPGEVDSLADRLTKLLRDPELCGQMGQAGKRRVAEKFLWSQVVDRIENGLGCIGHFANVKREGRRFNEDS